MVTTYTLLTNNADTRDPIGPKKHISKLFCGFIIYFILFCGKNISPLIGKNRCIDRFTTH